MVTGKEQGSDRLNRRLFRTCAVLGAIGMIELVSIPFMIVWQGVSISTAFNSPAASALVWVFPFRGVVSFLLLIISSGLNIPIYYLSGYVPVLCLFIVPACYFYLKYKKIQ
jgi:hypothetical protein